MPNTTKPTTKMRSTLTVLRNLVPTRPIAAHELARIAELQASRLRKHLQIDEDRFPETAISELPRIRIELEPELPSSGMTFWSGQDWVIVLNSSEPRVRRRFSLLHEYHHVVSHAAREQLFGPGARRNSPAAERTADQFAAFILMPKMLVKRYWGRGEDSRALARRFDVSLAAMNYRLHDLGLTQPTRRCSWSGSTYRRLLSDDSPTYFREKVAA